MKRIEEAKKKNVMKKGLESQEEGAGRTPEPSRQARKHQSTAALSPHAARPEPENGERLAPPPRLVTLCARLLSKAGVASTNTAQTPGIQTGPARSALAAFIDATQSAVGARRSRRRCRGSRRCRSGQTCEARAAGRALLRGRKKAHSSAVQRARGPAVPANAGAIFAVGIASLFFHRLDLSAGRRCPVGCLRRGSGGWPHCRLSSGRSQGRLDRAGCRAPDRLLGWRR